MPAATSSSHTASDVTERGVFVLELGGSPAFAFEAAKGSDAEQLVRSPWFARAIDRFCSGRAGKTVSNSRLRTATDEETSVFQDLADEFAEPTDHFFVAHLPGWKL